MRAAPRSAFILLLLASAAANAGGHSGGGHGAGHGGAHAGAHHGGGHFGGHFSGHHFLNHHRGGHVSLGFGYWPWYDAPSGYYYPPEAGMVYRPPVYVEHGDEQSGYWYYCTNPQGYYPYVVQCPGGWQQVKPQPPP